MDASRTQADPPGRILKWAVGGGEATLAGLILGSGWWLNSSLDSLDTRLVRLKVRLDAAEQRLDRIDRKLDQIRARLPVQVPILESSTQRDESERRKRTPSRRRDTLTRPP